MKRFHVILLILLVIQVGLILFLDRPVYTPEAKSPSFFPDFNAEQARRIEITQGNKRLVLIKDSGWLVEAGEHRYQANFFYIDTLLNSVQRLDRQNLLSRNPDKVKVFGLDGEAAIRLEVQGSGGAPMARLLVGKNLGPSRGTYVKAPDEDEVYLVMEDLRYACVRGDDWVTSWREEAVLKLEADSMQALRIEGPGGARTLDPIPEEMKEALVLLKGDGLAPRGTDPAQLGMEDSDLKLVIRHSAGESTLELSPDKDGWRYLMVDGDASTLYRVPSHVFQVFLD
jgi:hypothetical protein